MKLWGAFIRPLGIIESLVMSLPMPWRMRMGIASVLGRVIGWFLTHSATVYTYVIDRNREFGMGKQEPGEMQSIHALRAVLKEIERRRIPLDVVRQAVSEAEAANISKVEFARYVGQRVLGHPETQQLIRRLPCY